MAARRIPLDLIFEILVWLPTIFILRFKCVCKEWYNLINSPTFIKLHLNKSLEPNSQHDCMLLWITSNTLCGVDDLYQPVKAIKLNWPKDTVNDGDSVYFVGSCNGLVCFKIRRSREYPDYGIRRFLICNPTTRTFKSILPAMEMKWTHNSLSCGFGYDSVHDDYKIVVTSCSLGVTNKYVFTYSLNTDLWSGSSTPTRVPTGRNWTINSGAIYGNNNMLNYLVLSSAEIGDLITSDDYRIARYDVVSEKWRDDLSIPVQVSEFRHFVRLEKLDGLLYLHVGDLRDRSTEFWMMEEHDGSWKKMFDISGDLYMHHLIARSKDGHRLLLIPYFYSEITELFWYDQRDNTRTPFKLSETMPRHRESYELCIASLVAIPGGCSLTKLQQLG
ncbi:F-box/kelch-repeat protein At3g23880-like [Silene latifolia]|uniref:F-box/kelch-repeat protein At3g23880-like n=1 Tax=Silene latifolia TaxID=37657 RepID=UPI003D784A20